MFLFIAALVLLFVTCLLTVTDVVSVPLPVFILSTLFLFISVLVVLGRSYVYYINYVRRTVVSYSCYEFVSSQTPGSKSYSDWHFLVLLQIGVEQLRQKLKNVLDSFQSLNIHREEVSGLISHIIIAPLAIARSRLQPYHGAFPHSTSRAIVALACLAFLVSYLTSPALRYAVAKLAGLALSLYSTCTPISVGLFIAIVSISAYSFCRYLVRCRTIKHTESIYWTLRMVFSLEFDESYDKYHDFPIGPEPDSEPEVVCANAGHLPNLDDRQAYTETTYRPSDVSPSEAPSLFRNQGYTGVAPGFRSWFSSNLARLAYEESLRMQETSNKIQLKWTAEKASGYCYGLIGYRFVAQPSRSSSCSAAEHGSIDIHSEPTQPGVTPEPVDGISSFLGSMSLKGGQNPCSMTAGPQSPRMENTSSTPGRPIQTPIAPSTTPSPSHESLPELVPDANGSDSLSELTTPSGDGCETNNVIIRSSSKGSYAGLRRVRGLISQAQPKSSPLYAPKEIVEAQVASGENKVAALLHRSQWKQKQKQKRWTATKKPAKKAPAPVDLRLVPDTDTSDIPSELGTSSDERCEVGNVIIRPSSNCSHTSTRRVCGLITRAHPKRSPLYAPMMEAEVARGEDRVAAVTCFSRSIIIRCYDPLPARLLSRVTT
ncbi:hypothetical protein FRC10_007604, partial [Ceratobasidium sp. 414]